MKIVLCFYTLIAVEAAEFLFNDCNYWFPGNVYFEASLEY